MGTDGNRFQCVSHLSSGSNQTAGLEFRCRRERSPFPPAGAELFRLGIADNARFCLDVIALVQLANPTCVVGG